MRPIRLAVFVAPALLAALLLAPSTRGQPLVAFDPPTYLSAGNSPVSAATGDFNGDDDPDLAVANRFSSDVSVLLGGPGGSFGSLNNFPTGTLPASVAVADFNADGNPIRPRLPHHQQRVGAVEHHRHQPDPDGETGRLQHRRGHAPDGGHRRDLRQGRPLGHDSPHRGRCGERGGGAHAQRRISSHSFRLSESIAHDRLGIVTKNRRPVILQESRATQAPDVPAGLVRQSMGGGLASAHPWAASRWANFSETTHVLGQLQ